MIGAPREYSAADIRLGAAEVARSGFGWVLAANRDAVWWSGAAQERVRVALRDPASAPLSPGRAVLSPTGGVVDTGRMLVTPTAVIPVSSERQPRLGHTLLVRDHGTVRGLVRTLPDLPVGASSGDLRPFPASSGWVWVDTDTAYRRRPSGKTEAFARIPARIETWDVGPGGAFWCVGGHTLWVASATGLARRVPAALIDAMGVQLEYLAAGDFAFNDSGTAMALVETEATRVLLLGNHPRLGASVGAIVGLSPTPLPFPSAPAPARVTAASGQVVRISRRCMEVWSDHRPPQTISISLPAAPLTASGPHEGVVTMLSADGIQGIRLDGQPAKPLPRSLRDTPVDAHVEVTNGGPIWWSDNGMVVPLYRGVPVTPQ